MGIFVLYVVVMFFVSVYLSRKTDRKFLGFILMFWILTQPVLHSKFIIDIPGLPFDFQPNRILLIVLLLYFTTMKMLGVKGMQSQNGYVKPPSFEKFFYAYLIIITASLTYNYGYITHKNLVVIPSSILTFILGYHVAKNYMTKKLFDEVIKTIILLALTCALIAIIQIGINADFLKTGEPRIAFGSLARATGIFLSEYDLGQFQILALFIVITSVRRSFWRSILVLLLLLSILLTFHRLDILILIMSFAIYNLLLGQAANKVIMAAAMIFVVIVGGVTFSIFESSISDTDFAKERLSNTTIKGRFEQYGVIIKAIPKKALFGMGGYESKVYADLMIESGHAYSVNGGTYKWYKVPYEIHNGFLQVAAYHGLIALGVFVSMMYLMLMYFKRRLSREFPFTFVPFVAVLIWALSNLSNGMSGFSNYYILLLSIITGSFVSLYSRENEVEFADANSAADINKRLLFKK